MSYDYQKIDKLIEQSGLEKKSFFRKAGITEEYYNNCKSGQEIPKEEIMRRIANKLDVSFQELQTSAILKKNDTQNKKSRKRNGESVQTSINTAPVHNRKNRHLRWYIFNNINAYLHASVGKERHTAANHLRQPAYKELALQIVMEKLLIAPVSEKAPLIMLLFFIDREQNIRFCLDQLTCNNIKLDSVAFYQRLDTNPLNDNEQMEVAKHIATNTRFHIRLLSYIQGESLDYALTSILHSSINNGLTSKRLRALSLKKEYLQPVQAAIREKINNDANTYRKWIKYLDFSSPENQATVNTNYSLFEIYRELCEAPPEYYDSDFFKVRVIQHLLHKKSIGAEDWYEIKMIVLQEISDTNIDDNGILIDFLRTAYYVDATFAESLLITLYKKTTLYSKTVLEILSKVQSPFAYREMVNILLTTNDPKEQFRIARYLIKCFPHKSTAIIEYVKMLDNADLLKQATNDIQAIDQQKHQITAVPLFDSCNAFQIIPRTTQINELLLDLAKQINADTVFIAVGFAFSSGLHTLSGLIEYINRSSGNFELIIGALQNHNTSSNRKIDKQTVQLLNSLISKNEISLYTYENSFYHGKFYYIGSATQAYVVVGSSNISKTAFLENYELDMLFKIDPNQDNTFLKWYGQFKAVCTHLPSLNEANFLDLKWDSELNVFTEKFVRKLSQAELMDIVNELSDEEVKYRILTWLKYQPTDYYSDLEIPVLKGYTLFMYETYSLGVFESFSKDNAYYVFKCFSVEQLLSQVAQFTKRNELEQISTYVNRGYHIQNKDYLQAKISKFFEKQ